MSNTLNDQSVQATMLLPLWGRAKYSRANPDILKDSYAENIINNCGFDFSSVEKSFGDLSGISYLVRARKIEDRILDYIQKHPRATVVNIGSGLDTTFERIDNGQIHYYNLDLPDAIAYRRRFLPDSPRNACIGKSLFDTSWFDDIRFAREDGVIFVSGGVFFYFHEEDLKKIFAAMAERFPGGELYFDAECPMGVKGSNRMVKKSGNQNAMMYFSVSTKDVHKFEGWSPKIRLVSGESFFAGIKAKRDWTFRVRMCFRIIHAFRFMMFVRLKFTD